MCAGVKGRICYCPKEISSKAKLLWSGEVDVNSTELYNLSLTFSNSSSQVCCCHQKETREIVSCGLGTSCVGQCSDRGASLCPSLESALEPRQIGLDAEMQKAASMASALVLFFPTNCANFWPVYVQN